MLCAKPSDAKRPEKQNAIKCRSHYVNDPSSWLHYPPSVCWRAERDSAFAWVYGSNVCEMIALMPKQLSYKVTEQSGANRRTSNIGWSNILYCFEFGRAWTREHGWHWGGNGGQGGEEWWARIDHLKWTNEKWCRLGGGQSGGRVGLEREARRVDREVSTNTADQCMIVFVNVWRPSQARTIHDPSSMVLTHGKCWSMCVTARLASGYEFEQQPNVPSYLKHTNLRWKFTIATGATTRG